MDRPGQPSDHLYIQVWVKKENEDVMKNRKNMRLNRIPHSLLWASNVYEGRLWRMRADMISGQENEALQLPCCDSKQGVILEDNQSKNSLASSHSLSSNTKGIELARWQERSVASMEIKHDSLLHHKKKHNRKQNMNIHQFSVAALVKLWLFTQPDFAILNTLHKFTTFSGQGCLIWHVAQAHASVLPEVQCYSPDAKVWTAELSAAVPGLQVTCWVLPINIQISGIHAGDKVYAKQNTYICLKNNKTIDFITPTLSHF